MRSMADGAWEMEALASGLLQEECYLLARGGDAFLADPGIGCAAKAEARIRQRGWRLRGILLTHAHYDHAAEAGELGDRFHVPVTVHPGDRRTLAHAPLYARCFSGLAFRPPKEIRWLDGAAERELADFGIRALHVPGHTPGSVAFLCGDMVLTGDTLLCRSLARARLPEENRADLLASVGLLLEEAAGRGAKTLFPGHGAPWDVAEACAWWAHEAPVFWRRLRKGESGHGNSH